MATPVFIYWAILTKGAEKFVKIGNSIRPSVRLAQLKVYGIHAEEVRREQYDTKDEAELREKELARRFARLKYQPREHFCGHTECFTLAILEEATL